MAVAAMIGRTRKVLCRLGFVFLMLDQLELHGIGLMVDNLMYVPQAWRENRKSFVMLEEDTQGRETNTGVGMHLNYLTLSYRWVSRRGCNTWRTPIIGDISFGAPVLH